MDKNLIRKNNSHLVQHILFSEKKLFASDLVKLTGLSMVTINSLLKELVAQEIILEGPQVARDMGRPAVEYIFNDQSMYLLLLQFIEKKQRLYLYGEVIDLAGKIYFTHSIDATRITEDTFVLFLSYFTAHATSIDRIGISFPGKVYQQVVQSSWYSLFDGWNFSTLAQKIFDVPIYVQNDAHLITIGYSIQQKLPPTEIICGIFYPEKSRPGITIFSDGHLLEGQSGLAGEAKYLPYFLQQTKETKRSLAEDFSVLVSLYNAVIAPHRFILSTNVPQKNTIVTKVLENEWLKKQPNQPQIDFVEDAKLFGTIGLHSYCLQNTPFSQNN